MNSRSNIRHLCSGEIGVEIMTPGRRRIGISRHRAHCLNISQGGLGFNTPSKLREKEVVRLSLPLRDFDVTIPVLAEVLWVKPDDGHYRVGVRYVL